MVTNCKNCGAPLINGKCMYCKTEYRDSEKTVLYFNDEWAEHNAEFIHKVVMESILTPNEARKLVRLKDV